MAWTGGAFFVAFAVTTVLLNIGARTRGREEKTNADFDRVPTHQLGWHITHMRDDVSGIALSTSLTNALLAAILAQLMSR